MQDIFPPNRYPARRRLISPVRPVRNHRPVRPYQDVYAERRYMMAIAASKTTATVIVKEGVAAPLVATPKPISDVKPWREVYELSTNQKVRAMTRALEKARRDLEKERKKRFALKRLSLGLVSGLILLATGYVGYDTWMTNSRVKAETVAVSSQVSRVNVSNGVDDTSAAEGADKKDLPAAALADYLVAPNLPRALYINNINVAARVLPMGVNSDGSMQAPININDSGWYTGSVKPGEVGAVFINGHSSGASRQGLFGKLDNLKQDDTLQIEKGNGEKLTYRVVHTEVVALEDVDMKKMLLPYGNALRGLNLMTCSGTWVKNGDDRTLNERVLVFTEQI